MPRGPRAATPRYRLLALLGACLACALPLRAQEAPPGFDSGLFELRVANAPSTTVTALVNESGGVLLPLLFVTEATGLPFEISRDTTRVTLPLLGGRGSAVLDVTARELRVRGQVARLGPEEVIRHAGEVYLLSDRIAALLEAKVQVDFATLTATFARTPPFPAEQRALIAARRELLRRQSAAAESAGATVPYRPRSGAGVVEWSVGASQLPRLQGSSARILAGAAVLGGSLSVGGSAGLSGPGAGLSHSGLIASFSRVFPEGRLVRQLQLGDVTGGAQQVQSFRGAIVSNAPYRPETSFGQVLVNPNVPPGWSYEVYQGGRLLGFSEGTTRGPVVVPLEYGTTRVQVRMYGPAGEEATSELQYLVPFTQLTPGRWEYSGGGGVCPGNVCDTYSFVDLRHGLSTWLTLGSGASLTTGTGSPDFRPHGIASVALPGGWAGELRHLSRTFTRGVWSYSGRGPVWATGGAAVSHPGSGLVSFLESEEARWDATLSLGVRSTTLPPVLRTVRLGGRVEGTTSGSTDRVQVFGGWSLFRSVFEVVYESNRLQEHPLLSLQATAVAPERGPGWLRGRALTTRVGLEGSTLQQVDLATSLHLAPRHELGVVARCDRRAVRPTLSLGYSAYLGSARVQSRLVAPARGGPSAGISADGGVAFGEGVGVHATDRTGIGAAGVAGHVFQDLDGNGRFGPGDEPLRSARILIGALRATTDERGRYELWGVPAYDVAAVRVDTISLPDPAWIPLQGETRVRPVPHAFTRIDFALVPTRELSGRLVAGPGVATAGGVTVEIEERSTGTVLRTVTFTDGEYYLSRLRPGEYRLRIVETALRALRARAEPEVLDFSIPAQGEVPVVELPPIRLLRVPSGEEGTPTP